MWIQGQKDGSIHLAHELGSCFAFPWVSVISQCVLKGNPQSSWQRSFGYIMVTSTWRFKAILGPGLQDKFSDLQRNRSPENFWSTDNYYSWSKWCWIWHSYHKGNSQVDCWFQITLMPPLVLHHRIPSLTSFKMCKGGCQALFCFLALPSWSPKENKIKLFFLHTTCIEKPVSFRFVIEDLPAI